MVISDEERKAEFRNFLKSFGIDNVTEEECDKYLKLQEACVEECEFAEKNNILALM